MESESMEHLFSKCIEANELWGNVVHWIENKIGFHLRMSDSYKILGYLTMDKNIWPINLILLVTRKYIFWCSRNSLRLPIFHLEKGN